MKLNTTHLLAFIWACLVSFLLFLGFTSCSAQYHYKKAIKKGVQIVPTSDTITLTKVDSILINNEWVKVVTEFDTIIEYNTVYVPKTRYQTRIEYKTKKDSLHTIRYVTRQETKQVAKQSGSRLVWAIAFGLVALIVLVLIIKWVKSWIK
jgi:hypothetical protein